MWRREDEMQAMLRESAEGYVSSNHSPARFRDCRKSVAGFDPDAWIAMGELGWTGILLPEAMGGTGLGLAPALTLAEIFGDHLLPEPFVASAVIAATVLGASSSTCAAELGSDLAAGRKVIVLADREELGVLGPSQSTSLLRCSNGGFVLSGRKMFVPAWTNRTVPLVTTILDGEPAIVAVTPESAGLAAQLRRMTDGSISADIEFTDVNLGADALLLAGDIAGDAVRLATARGRLALSAQLEGLSRKLLRMTAEYVGQRVQFGHPLASFQSIRHGLADLHTAIELSGASWRSAAAALEDGASDAAFSQISAAKARGSETALAVARSAIQYHGAFGYTEEADVGLYVNAALRWASWLGNAQAHRRNALRLHRKRQTEHA